MRGGVVGAGLLAFATGVVGYALGRWDRTDSEVSPAATAGVAAEAGAVPAPAAPVADSRVAPDRAARPATEAGFAPYGVDGATGPTRPIAPDPEAGAGRPLQTEASVVRGLIRGPDGASAPEAAILLVRATPAMDEGAVAWERRPWWWGDSGLPELARARAGPDGRFQLAVLNSGRMYLMVRLHVRPPARAVVALTLTPGAATEVDVRCVVLQARITLSGTVRGVEGRRLAGARVSAWWKDARGEAVYATTDERGEYTLGPLAPLSAGPPQLESGAEADGHAWTGYGWRVDEDGPVAHDVVLQPVSRVRGHVRVSPGDVRLEELAVACRRLGEAVVDPRWDTRWYPRVHLDTKTGEYEIEDDATGLAELAVTGPGIEPKVVRVELPALGSTLELDVEVVPALRVRLPVRAADGGPLPEDIAARLSPPDSPQAWWVDSGLVPGESVPYDPAGWLLLPARPSAGTWLTVETGSDDWPEAEHRVVDGWPAEIVLRRWDPALEAAILEPRGSVSDLQVTGEWRVGEARGAFDVRTSTPPTGSDGSTTLTVRRPWWAEPATVTMQLRLPGWRPIVIGPITLQPGERLPVTEFRFERD